MTNAPINQESLVVALRRICADLAEVRRCLGLAEGTAQLKATLKATDSLARQMRHLGMDSSGHEVFRVMENLDSGMRKRAELPSLLPSYVDTAAAELEWLALSLDRQDGGKDTQP